MVVEEKEEEVAVVVVVEVVEMVRWWRWRRQQQQGQGPREEQGATRAPRGWEGSQLAAKNGAKRVRL